MSTTEDNLFQEQCLTMHNKLRAKHGCPPLQLEQKLTDVANRRAQAIANRGSVDHGSAGQYGENVYVGKGIHINGDVPVKSWYSEMKDYSFKAAKFIPKCGHFTQLIWKGSQELGVGISRKDNTSYVVAFYSPAGNVQGDFRENVLPLTKKISVVKE